jgi:hypothetical protein
MNGGDFSNNARVTPITIENGWSFAMSGGAITGNYNIRTDASVVFVTGAGSAFTMSGSAVISNNNNYSDNTGGGGGGVRVSYGASFTMSGGTIKGNYTRGTNPSEPSYGGGVFIASGGIFTKTGGIIYGLDEGSPDWNRVENNPSPPNLYAAQGYAVYCEDGPKYRDNTAAGAMNSAVTGSPGGWE